MELGSALMTPLGDGVPVILQYKFYWIHERLWDQSWIDKYHLTAPGLARDIQARKGADGQFTCDDFAFEILIEFASRNKLPLKIRTGVHVHKNIDEVLDVGAGSPPTPAGFAMDVAYTGGVRDVIRNSIQVSMSDLKPGDMFAEFNRQHVQVVTHTSATRIEVMQGNFPGVETVTRRQGAFLHGGSVLRSESTSDRKSPYYLGVPVQNAMYEYRNGLWLYHRVYGNDHEWSATTWNDMSTHLRWDFLGFNKL